MEKLKGAGQYPPYSGPYTAYQPGTNMVPSSGHNTMGGYVVDTWKPQTRSGLGSTTPQTPPRVQTPYMPNAFTQAQLGQFNNGQRGNFENNPAYQQYVAKMNNMYGVSPVGAAGDVLDGQTAFNAGIGGKSAPTTGGSNV